MPQCFQAVSQVLTVTIIGDPLFEELFTNQAAAKPSAWDNMLFGLVFIRMYLDLQCGHCEDMNILAFQSLA